MGIRQSIGAGAVPWEIKYALDACNNKLAHGQDNSTVDALLTAAEGWDEAARAALEAGNIKLHGVYSRHAERYMRAAEQVEQYDAKRNDAGRVRPTGR